MNLVTSSNTHILHFNNLRLKDLPLVGGKNASLGEMTSELSSHGIRIPEGFAVTTHAYWKFIDRNLFREKLQLILNKLDTDSFSNLSEISNEAQQLLLSGKIPEDVSQPITDAYHILFNGRSAGSVAVRSSATAEDLPSASFAGQQETYLNISGDTNLLSTCKKCFASLFTQRAIKYRFDHGFDQMEVALSIGIQRMVRSDLGCSGVAFTLEPETGFQDVMVINAAWGLGENIVQGAVDPDEYLVFKPSLKRGKKSVIFKKAGSKEITMIYAAPEHNHSPGITTTNIPTPKEKQVALALEDHEIELLAKWMLIIEKHYKTPMDIEWAKDGTTDQLFIVQARPETVHTQASPHIIKNYELEIRGNILVSGIALGNKIASGRVRILQSPSEADKLRQGEVLVTDITNPDWDPIMKKAAAIITNKGGRTSHAAIVARELEVVAIVGSGDATTKLNDGQEVTVSCAEGKTGFVYDGLLKWKENIIDTRKIKLPRTEMMLILADPDKAFKYSFLPNNGVGLMRMEFVISNSIRIHPMALLNYNELSDKEARQTIKELTLSYKTRESYFIDKLSQAVAIVASAFYPKDVIVRMSDFKTNEYANLIGGKQFEPKEENPMLGYRGASRYYSPLYREGFRLECEAMKVVRDEMGLTNVKLMIPFCRTVDEGRKVISLMADNGLKQGQNGLEIYTMIEVPSNVILAEEFAEVFDGFSIGSNDLTQLTLGLDRDSELISHLFDENNEAVKRLISQVIAVARRKKIKIGLCGQAPSDFPEFAGFLVEAGINSISFNPDALLQGIKNTNQAEQKHRQKASES